jgi:hypothetical protein
LPRQLYLLILPLAILTLSTPLLSTESRYVSTAESTGLGYIASPVIRLGSITGSALNLNAVTPKTLEFKIYNSTDTQRNDVTLLYRLFIRADTINLADPSIAVLQLQYFNATNNSWDTVNLNYEPATSTLSTADLLTLGFAADEVHQFKLNLKLVDPTYAGQSFNLRITTDEIHQYIPTS